MLRLRTFLTSGGALLAATALSRESQARAALKLITS